MTILEFMSDSPILTFFIVLIIAECIYKSICAMKGKFDNKDQNNDK